MTTPSIPPNEFESTRAELDTVFREISDAFDRARSMPPAERDAALDEFKPAFEELRRATGRVIDRMRGDERQAFIDRAAIAAIGGMLTEPEPYGQDAAATRAYAYAEALAAERDRRLSGKGPQ